MILDAQKSRDHPLSNGSKTLIFVEEKYFPGAMKKVLIKFWNTVYYDRT